MTVLIVSPKFRSLIKKFGLAKTAHILGCRYSVVRDAVSKAGIEIKRGRRADKTISVRNKEIRAVRKKSKKYLHQIGKQFNIGRERVRQILIETGGDPLK